MRYSTPLRYPGGKSKLACFIKLTFEVNGLKGSHYIEPYAGGAGIAFHLLLSGYTSHVHLNDVDRALYAFWCSILEDTENFCRLVHDTPVTMHSWKQQKLTQKNPDSASTLQLGFSTFFLNRTNRSGIIRGGVIGGKKQNGDWSLGARYNKTSLIARISKIAQFKEKITLHNQDASEFILWTLPKLPQTALVYLDPPYYSKSKRLYKNHYKHEDHDTVATLVKSQIKQKWIVSYDDTPEIRKLYKGYQKLFYKLNYSANSHNKGSEVMFFCHDLNPPEVKNPIKLDDALHHALNSVIHPLSLSNL